MSVEKKVAVIFTVLVDDEDEETACERVESLVKYGTVKDAFFLVGMELVDAKVRTVG